MNECDQSFWCFPGRLLKRNDNSVSGCWEVEVGAKGATIWHFPELDSIMWHGQACRGKNFRELRVEKYNIGAYVNEVQYRAEEIFDNLTLSIHNTNMLFDDSPNEMDFWPKSIFCLWPFWEIGGLIPKINHMKPNCGPWGCGWGAGGHLPFSPFHAFLRFSTPLSNTKQ